MLFCAIYFSFLYAIVLYIFFSVAFCTKYTMIMHAFAIIRINIYVCYVNSCFNTCFSYQQQTFAINKINSGKKKIRKEWKWRSESLFFCIEILYAKENQFNEKKRWIFVNKKKKGQRRQRKKKRGNKHHQMCVLFLKLTSWSACARAKKKAIYRENIYVSDFICGVSLLFYFYSRVSIIK